MARILHVGNGNEKHRGRRFYDVGRKLQHGLVRCDHNALFFSDRDVLRHAGWLGTRLGGAQRCNDQLIQVAHNFRPDMLLLGHADIITNNTLQILKSEHPALRIAQFNVDPVFRPENDAAIRARLPHVDASFITTGGSVLQRYATPQAVAAYIPNPVDAALETHRCHEQAQTEYDVFYAVRAMTTTGSQEENDRLRLPRYVREQVEGLRPHFFGFDGADELFGAAYYDAIGRCAMGLNLSHKQTTKGAVIQATEEERYLYTSDRLSQYVGCGLLCFSERGFAMEQFFTEEEMVFFADKEELADKLRYYKQHSDARMRIAAAGWHKAHTQMSAAQVAQFIVEVTMGGQAQSDYGWDATCYRG